MSSWALEGISGQKTPIIHGRYDLWEEYLAETYWV